MKPWCSGILEGKDTIQNLEAPYADINRFMKESALELALAEGFDSVISISGGDCVSCSSVLGLSPIHGSALHCSCFLCECPMSEYHDSDKAQSYPLRTILRIKQLAHALGLMDDAEFTPFSCPGCDMEFNTVADIHTWVDSVASMTELEIADYVKEHYGVYPGKGPLLEGVEPIYFIICVLHMRLSLTKTWWKVAISEQLKGSPAYAKCKLINQILKEDVFTWKQTSLSKAGTIDAHGFNDKSFNGAESAHVYQYAAKLVDAVTTSSNAALAIFGEER